MFVHNYSLCQLFADSHHVSDSLLEWGGIFEALRGIGYDGYVSFELGGLSDPICWVSQAKAYGAKYV